MTQTLAVLCAVAMLLTAAPGAAADSSTGSGIVINTKGEILTNSHVVVACRTITVKFASGTSEAGILATRDEKNDLAVVRLSGANSPPTSVAVFREGPPVRAGDTIVALGYPLSGVLATDANVSVGNVSALAGVADDSRYLQISAPVQPGNSGGPLLDQSGHLVGIVTAKLNALRVARFTGDIPENVNFALKTEVARTFLDSKGIQYQMARSDRQLSPSDVGDIARPFTVHIECERANAQAVAAISLPTQSHDEQSGLCKDHAHPSSLSQKTVDEIIEACSIEIGSTQVLGPKVAEAFLIRGAAYRIRHEYSKAHQDLLNAAQSSYASNKTAGSAERLLGTMSMLGEFEDPLGAIIRFGRAADKGDGMAMFYLAGIYAGQETKYSCDQARAWVQKAIAAGYEDGKQELRSGFGGKCRW
jgi:Trypsin-like peptidase domain